MPEDSKKDKKKHDPKEQRRPRQRHQQSADKKQEKKVEEPKSAPKVIVPQKPPVYEQPPPEFYKNLKRETDEILKITEEENTKYKKKEIQSNWSKYEMPIESYDEIEEQENMGADYEKLIQAPLSVGGHFQFKHEKSWDINTGPSLYDKYFDINMEDLNLALCSVPFYERNGIDKNAFSQTDILTMDNRATRFKQKYFNDKSYSTPETEAQDKILRGLCDNKDDTSNSIKDTETISHLNSGDVNTVKVETLETDINFDFKNEPQEAKANIVDKNKINEGNILDNKIDKAEIKTVDDSKITGDESEHDDFVFGITSQPVKLPETQSSIVEVPSSKVETTLNTIEMLSNKIETPSSRVESVISKVETPIRRVETPPKEVKPSAPRSTEEPPKAQAPPVPKVGVTKQNPVIESPEDLEKWLDDFLDG